MEILIQPMTDAALMRRACDMTRKPGVKASSMSLDKIYRCEHSPIRTLMFWIELHGIPTKVSVHIVRHKHGVEHFVESNRDDRGGAGDDEVTRNTPVNHGMFANAQALIQMSRKRLCYHSHQATVATWMRLKKAMKKHDPDLAAAMVPECIYRNGFCPELRECKPGLAAVIRAYQGERDAKANAR